MKYVCAMIPVETPVPATEQKLLHRTFVDAASSPLERVPMGNC